MTHASSVRARVMSCTVFASFLHHFLLVLCFDSFWAQYYRFLFVAVGDLTFVL
jgi:hypothetical protein